MTTLTTEWLKPNGDGKTLEDPKGTALDDSKGAIGPTPINPEI